MEYILGYWKEMYIVPHIYDNVILDVLKDFKIKVWAKIMRILISHNLAFYYSTFKKEAIEYAVNEIKSISKPNIITKRNVNSSGLANSKWKDLLMRK